jgi:peptidoglycan hydrolase-like protein with peptidoglycan-binding domain
MRLYEFKSVEFNTTLKKGPPFPTADRRLVRRIQTKLEELGYSVGGTGIDGKYGPRTAAAVSQYKQDFNVSGDGDSLEANEWKAMLAAKPKPGREPVKRQELELDDIKLDDAKKSAEDFLGREMSDSEWNYLVRATIAEASPNTTEQGYVMAVILNRAREGYNGDTNVIDILKQRNQFQAVTGTRFSPGPSRNFTRNPSGATLRSIANAAVKVLPNADKSYMNFTAADPSAYGPGTNIAFLRKMIKGGGKKIGGTIFGTVN